MPIIQTVIKGKEPVIDALSVTPSTSAQQITAPQGTDGYSPVNVSAVTSSIDANIVAGNIKKDVQILGVTGSYEGTTPTGTVNITSNGTHNVSSYEYADVQVPTTAPSRYLEYSVDANGKLIHDPTASSIINLNGATDIGDYVLYYAYNGNASLTGNIDLSMLEQITGNSGCGYAFFACSNITGADLRNLKYISSQSGCMYMFRNCPSLTTMNLSSLKYISGTSACSNMFSYCVGLTGTMDLSKLIALGGQSELQQMFQMSTGITGINLSSLVTTNNTAMNGICYGCANLTSADFSHLAKIGTSQALSNAFSNTSLSSLSFPNLAYIATSYNSSFGNMLSGVTGCTVHFPAEWQTTMSSWSNVTNGFGGTNTTVLFDLPNVTTLDLSHITEIEYYNEFYQFGRNNYFPNITSVDLSGLKTITGNSACSTMFSGTTGLTSVNLSKLETIDGYNTCSGMFNNTGLTSIDLSCLTTVAPSSTASQSCNEMFYNCDEITTVNLSSLKTVGTNGLSRMFADCGSITTLSFPALKNITNAQSFNGLCAYTIGITVHFPSNMSGSGITASILGGNNMTVLFDLPATNILTGADTKEYERNPKYDTATALAWRINGTMPNTTTYYTSGLTDPTVGTTIYSDSACTIAETTVDSVI